MLKAFGKPQQLIHESQQNLTTALKSPDKSKNPKLTKKVQILNDTESLIRMSGNKQNSIIGPIKKLQISSET